MSKKHSYEHIKLKTVKQTYVVFVHDEYVVCTHISEYNK